MNPACVVVEFIFVFMFLFLCVFVSLTNRVNVKEYLLRP